MEKGLYDDCHFPGNVYALGWRKRQPANQLMVQPTTKARRAASLDPPPPRPVPFPHVPFRSVPQDMCGPIDGT